MTLRSLGKYQIEAILGQGAMGVVYRAYDPVIKRRVALKTISGDFKQDPELLRRFYLEAQAAGSLRHNNIVTIYDLGEEHHQPYIAMEYLEGENLQTLIKTDRVVTLNRALHFIHQCCKGLHYAHGHNIVHRDIKPANVFVLDDDTAKIVDFGIAMVGSSTITKTGMILGTVSYMSPEQVSGEELDGRSDQFSLGIILYELLSGTKPFEGGTIVEIFNKIINHDYPPIRSVYPSCPESLELILDRCLARDRNQRYDNLEEMARDLERLLSKLPREYSLSEDVVVETNEHLSVWLNELDDIAQKVDSGILDDAAWRLGRIQERWQGKDPLLDARVASLQARIRFMHDREKIHRRLDNIRTLARDGLFDQAEHLLDKLEEEYPESEEIFDLRKSLLEEKQASEKFQHIQAQVSRATFLLAEKEYNQALQTVESVLNQYPEEKGLLGFYRRILDERSEYEKQVFRQNTFRDAQNLLQRGEIGPAIAKVEEALSRYPEDESFQRFYRTLMSLRRGDR
ncbi:MAG: serine/threonine protein kinase [Acidobacteria bacterium]|nr:serine/threonine protein kinase [Acidobacteriota bacterium]